MSLKTDYKDAIPATPQRKYKMTDNGDGTYSFQDVTQYSQVGDKAQASVFNGIGTEVNGHISSTNNPHQVTKAQLGLDKVNNTADADKSVKYADSTGTCNGNSVTSTTSTYAHYSSHAVGPDAFAVRNIIMSTGVAQGGQNGDVWHQYK